MKKLQEKIMAASFGRLLKRWVIAALCVALLGGGISAALLCSLLAFAFWLLSAAWLCSAPSFSAAPGLYPLHGFLL